MRITESKASHIKSFVHGHPPASWKYFLIYRMNLDYCQQTKEKKQKQLKTFNSDKYFLFSSFSRG